VYCYCYCYYYTATAAGSCCLLLLRRAITAAMSMTALITSCTATTRHITLNETLQGYKQYQVCVEEHLKKLLTAYIVYSIKDKNALQRVISMSGCAQYRKPTIIMVSVPATERHAVPVHTDVLQMMSAAVSVHNTEVFNAVVDHARIEHVLLAPGTAAASALLQGDSGNQQLPYKAHAVMYPQGGCKLAAQLFTCKGNVNEHCNMGRGVKLVLGGDSSTVRQQCSDRLEAAEALLEEHRLAYALL
jgi:hypothetical protein